MTLHHNNAHKYNYSETLFMLNNTSTMIVHLSIIDLYHTANEMILLGIIDQ